MDHVDYASTGLSIQQSMLDKIKRFPDKKSRPKYIIWNGLHVQTYDWWSVPKTGVVQIEFLDSTRDPEQGMDVSVENGGIRLASGEMIPVLRTWRDDRYEDIVEYEYVTGTGRLCVWNVYKVEYRAGGITEEKWTSNAGFWVENLSNISKVYHCSPGLIDKPNFSGLVFKVTVTGS
jgi:hypothetical protein